MQLTSPAFEHMSTIPAEYGFEGENKNPPLAMSGVPAGATSLAILMHDPDAVRGDFLHWVAWNLPASTTNIAPGALPAGAITGQNSIGQAEYMRPAPPPGSGTHHYMFTLYALDSSLDLPPDASRADIESAIAAHTLATADLTGLYGRG